MSNEKVDKVIDNFCEGRIVNVGAHKVKIVDHIAEGGFAQIYSVQFLEYLNDSIGVLQPNDLACLKRVLVNDENGLNELRNEVSVMQKLKGKSKIVQFFDSNAAHRTDNKPGYEVSLLMELCPNKSLLDYMNQRLATKLTEPEILKIMFDITLAIAHMHFLKQPLIHRDIKIENVLVDANHDFKLCDFGSTSTCFPIATTHHSIALLAQNIYVHTTPQYRSPEMVDLYRCLPINEKSDIWALGIFLYKLLFFTTPFERTGQFAILHSKYEFPQNNFSSRLVNLIIIMLSENPNLRPNIWQVLCEICSMLDIKVPIEDRYLQGPYNFQDYSFFQNKLQTLQNQMFDLQTKKLMGSFENKDNHLLNALYMSTFNIVPNIPLLHDANLSMGSNISSSGMPLPAIPNATILRTDANNNINQNNEGQNYQVQPAFMPTVNNQAAFPLQNQFQENKFSTDNDEPSGQPLSQEDGNDKTEPNDRFEDRYYPTVEEFNKASSDRNINNPGAILHTEPPANFDEIGVSSQSARQYKSGNPFPMLQNENNQNEGSPHYSRKPISNTNPYSNSPPKSQSYPEQTQQPINSSMLQRVPNTTTAITQIQPNMQNQYSPISPHANIGQMAANNPMINISRIQGNIHSATDARFKNDIPTTTTTTTTNRMDQAYEAIARSPSMPPKSPPSIPVDRPNSRQIDNISSTTQPPILPPHPKRKSIDISSGTSSKSPPIIPPHPKRKLDDSTINLYSSSSNSEKNSNSMSGSSANSKIRSKGTGIPSVVDNSGTDQNKSGSRTMVLIDPPTSESIEFDVDEAQRKALNLKLEKLAIQNNDRLKANDLHSRHNASSITLTQEVAGMEALKANAKNVRKSLDLERSREELFTDTSKKRGGLFSILKSDHKQ